MFVNTGPEPSWASLTSSCFAQMGFTSLSWPYPCLSPPLITYEAQRMAEDTETIYSSVPDNAQALCYLSSHCFLENFSHHWPIISKEPVMCPSLCSGVCLIISISPPGVCATRRLDLIALPLHLSLLNATLFDLLLESSLVRPFWSLILAFHILAHYSQTMCLMCNKELLFPDCFSDQMLHFTQHSSPFQFFKVCATTLGCFLLFIFIHFTETKSFYVAQNGLEVSVETRLALNFRTSCWLSLLSIGITGIYHHVLLMPILYNWNPWKFPEKLKNLSRDT